MRMFFIIIILHIFMYTKNVCVTFHDVTSETFIIKRFFLLSFILKTIVSSGVVIRSFYFV